MRKLIVLLMVVLLGMTTFAQERTVNLNGGRAWNLSTRGVRFVYTGTADDTLKATNQDSILFVLQVGDKNRLNRPLHFQLNISSKGLVGTDTTFVVHSDYRISTTNTTYSELVPNITSSVNTVAGINTTVTSYGIIADYTTTESVGTYNITEAAYDGVLVMDTTATWPNPESTSTIDSVLYTGTTTNASHLLAVGAQTITTSSVQNPQLHARYMTFLLIIEGDDSVGEGIEIEELEIIFDL